MISNQPSNLRPFHKSHHYSSDRPYESGQAKPRIEEDTLKSEKIQIERKTFILTLKENPRGRFLRITEDVNGRRDNIIIPSTGLEDFSKILDAMVQAAMQPPSKSPSEPK